MGVKDNVLAALFRYPPSSQMENWWSLCPAYPPLLFHLPFPLLPPFLPSHFPFSSFLLLYSSLKALSSPVIRLSSLSLSFKFWIPFFPNKTQGKGSIFINNQNTRKWLVFKVASTGSLFLILCPYFSSFSISLGVIILRLFPLLKSVSSMPKWILNFSLNLYKIQNSQFL